MVNMTTYPHETFFAVPAVSGSLDEVRGIYHEEDIAAVFCIWIYDFVHSLLLVMELEKGAIHRKPVTSTGNNFKAAPLQVLHCFPKNIIRVVATDRSTGKLCIGKLEFGKETNMDFANPSCSISSCSITF